jgi:hypothetical protein
MMFAQVPANQGRRVEVKSLCNDILKKKRVQLEGKLTSGLGAIEIKTLDTRGFRDWNETWHMIQEARPLRLGQ